MITLMITVTLSKTNQRSLSNCGLRQSTSAPILADFVLSADVFLCRSYPVKRIFYRSADFHGFGYRWSVELTVDWLLKEIFIMLSAEGPPGIWRQSADDLQTIGRWHFIKQPSADRCRISTVIPPMIAPMSTDLEFWLISLDLVFKNYLFVMLDFSLKFTYDVLKLTSALYRKCYNIKLNIFL